MKKSSEIIPKSHKKEKKTRRGRPRKLENWTAKILTERAGHYFDKCDTRMRMVVGKNGPYPVAAPAPYPVEGLCEYLNITQPTFLAWRKKEGELGDAARRIHLRITDNRITGALDGTQNAHFAQFLLKNTNPEEYRDSVEVKNEVTGSIRSVLDLCRGTQIEEADDAADMDED